MLTENIDHRTNCFYLFTERRAYRYREITKSQVSTTPG